MRLSRRDFLLYSVSSLALLGASALRAAPVHAVPEVIYEPRVEAMAAAVRSIVTLLHPYPLGVDLSDMRAGLKDGGKGACGEGRV